MLLGLFGATGYDSAIIAVANRLITGDAFTAVSHAYALHRAGTRHTTAATVSVWQTAAPCG
jgi:hypothetical protein